MTQSSAILAFLQRGRCLTPMDALRRFGTFRLAARILELRQSGHRIDTRIVGTRTGKRVAIYRLS